jgi:hypothetical protein
MCTILTEYEIKQNYNPAAARQADEFKAEKCRKVRLQKINPYFGRRIPE